MLPNDLYGSVLGIGIRMHEARSSSVRLILGLREQAKALSELFKSMSVLGKWPENRLFSNIAHPLTSGRMPTIWQLALISFVDESYESGCQGNILPPSLPKGDGCGDLHPARSQIWRGSGFATCSRQTKAVGGFYSTVS
jgi:hypothetical protein